MGWLVRVQQPECRCMSYIMSQYFSLRNVFQGKQDTRHWREAVSFKIGDVRLCA